MGRESKRQQLMEAARMVADQQRMEAQAKQVLPRGQRFIQQLLQVRPGVKAWREDLERSLALAEKFNLVQDAEVMRESLASVATIEDRFDRLYCQVLGNDLKREPVFVKSAREVIDQLEKDYLELQAEDKAAEEADKAAKALAAEKAGAAAQAQLKAEGTLPPEGEKPGLILLSGKS